MKLSLILLSTCLLGVAHGAAYSVPSKYTWDPTANAAEAAAANAANTAAAAANAANAAAANAAAANAAAVVPTTKIASYLVTLQNVMPTTNQTQEFLNALNVVRTNLPDVTVLLNALQTVLQKGSELGLDTGSTGELTKTVEMLKGLQTLQKLGGAMLDRLQTLLPGLNFTKLVETIGKVVGERDASAFNKAIAAALSLPTMGANFAAKVLTSEVTGLGDIAKLAISMGDKSLQAVVGLGTISTNMATAIGKEAIGGISGIATLGLSTVTDLARSALGMFVGLGKVLIPAGPFLNGAAAFGGRVVDNLNNFGKGAINAISGFTSYQLDAINGAVVEFNKLVGVTSTGVSVFWTKEVDLITGQLNAGISTSLKSILAKLNSQ